MPRFNEDFLDKTTGITRNTPMLNENREPLIIRPATLGDLDAIEQIEQRAYPHPWSRAVLRNAVRGDEDFSYFYVARLEMSEAACGPIIGYHHFWLVADELHILNIAIDPAYQRRGYAGQLLQFAFDFGQQRGALSAFLEVRASNLPAQKLYASFGFTRIDTRSGYYSDTHEDAYVMRLTII